MVFCDLTRPAGTEYFSAVFLGTRRMFEEYHVVQGAIYPGLPQRGYVTGSISRGACWIQSLAMR